MEEVEAGLVLRPFERASEWRSAMGRAEAAVAEVPRVVAVESLRIEQRALLSEADLRSFKARYR